MGDEEVVSAEAGTGVCEEQDVPQEDMAPEPDAAADAPAMDEATMMASEQQAAMEASVEEPAMAAEDAGMMEELESMEPWMGMPEGVPLTPAPEGLIDSSTLEAHALTDFMPLKSTPEYEALKESICINGLQQPLTRFEGKILDGRHRLRACAEFGIPVAVMDFGGSTDDAMIYVLQANQYHHDYTISQRAAIAALLVPEIAEMVAQGRLEKVRAAWEAKLDGGCCTNLGSNLPVEDSETRSTAIAGAMLRVSSGYVSQALRLQREAPELFEQLHAGTITMRAALKELSGEVDEAYEQEARAARSDFNRALRNPDRYPDFLQRFREFMAQFQE